MHMARSALMPHTNTGGHSQGRGGGRLWVGTSKSGLCPRSAPVTRRSVNTVCSVLICCRHGRGGGGGARSACIQHRCVGCQPERALSPAACHKGEQHCAQHAAGMAGKWACSAQHVMVHEVRKGGGGGVQTPHARLTLSHTWIRPAKRGSSLVRATTVACPWSLTSTLGALGRCVCV